jgi:hypothetical protein
MDSNPVRWSSFGARLRAPLVVLLLFGSGAAVAACGGGSPSASTAGSTPGSASSSGSCSGVPGAHHARLVVEPSAGKVVARCVGFSGSGLPALKLITKSLLEVGTQTFSFGVAICQVDNVPAHYSKCLPTGQDYWALFLSKNGRTWTSPPVGVSDIKVPAGGSLGLRYDPPTGKPAPPPRPSPA